MRFCLFVLKQKVRAVESDARTYSTEINGKISSDFVFFADFID